MPARTGITQAKQGAGTGWRTRALWAGSALVMDVMMVMVRADDGGLIAVAALAAVEPSTARARREAIRHFMGISPNLFSSKSCRTPGDVLRPLVRRSSKVRLKRNI